MSYLVLVRHGLSDYNKQGLWTGWDNPPLVPEGLTQAEKTAQKLKDINFDYAYSSDQIRSVQTLEEILKTIGQNVLINQNEHLRERNYGIYTKRNKWEIKKELGDEEFQKLRRGWDYPIPEGESLKQVYEREIPYFKSEILPKLKEGKNILIGSSGNALRALAKDLENISENQIATLEIGTGEAYVYDINSEGKVVSKEVRGKNPLAGKV
ncbi:MAG: histidine phosphatase family protein [Candidatus Levybacteria bacterium]|nr:histidine phosphatase family protein [Candidatus Levybacteria bacterium]MBP9815203.1 histidine phosphatase family protein [Candidatus Levybacteria bacterium]